MKLIEKLKNSFILPPSFELSDKELVAMKNLVEVAKERLWLIDNLNRRPKDFHEKYDETMTDEQMDIVLTSCNIVDKCINRYGTNQLPDN